jgi:hypothetical protein
MHALASEHKKTRAVGKSNALVSSEGQQNSTSQKEKWEIQCIAIPDEPPRVFTTGDSLRVYDLATTDLKHARHAFELRYRAALAAVKYGHP